MFHVWQDRSSKVSLLVERCQTNLPNHHQRERILAKTSQARQTSRKRINAAFFSGHKQADCWKFISAQSQASKLGSRAVGHGRKRQNASQDIAALEYQLNHPINSETSHVGFGQWCSSQSLASRVVPRSRRGGVGRITQRCEVLRTNTKSRRHCPMLADDDTFSKLGIFTEQQMSTLCLCEKHCWLCAHGTTVDTTCSSLLRMGWYAMHTQTCEEIEIHRRGGKFETDAEIVPPFHGQAKT